MPGVDGFEVCIQIKATQDYWFDGFKKSLSLVKFKTMRMCPVVAVTAFTDESTFKKAEKVGMKKVINKPVSKTELEEVLKKYYYDIND